MHRRALALAALLVAAAASASAQHRTPLSVEARAGAAFPLGSFGDLVNTGTDVGALAELRLTPILGVFAGYDRDWFGTERGSRIGDRALSGDVVSSAVRLGVQWMIPVGGGPIQPFLRTGVFLNQVSAELEERGGSRRVDSDRIAAFSIDAGAGFALRRGSSLALVPALRYYSLLPRFELNDGRVEMRVRYLALSLGLRVSP